MAERAYCCCCKAAGPENERVADEETSWDGETPPEMASPLNRAVGRGAGSSKCINGETVLWNALALLDLGLSAVAAAAVEILVLVAFEEVDISILTVASSCGFSSPPPPALLLSNAGLSTTGAFSLSA